MSKTQSSQRKAKPSTTSRTAVAEAAACPPTRKAVVLGRVEAGDGKMYQVLAPAVLPQHLSLDDIELAVEMMVAAR